MINTERVQTDLYEGNGSTTSFSVEFNFDSNDDLVVVLVDLDTFAETPLTEGTDYSLTGAGTGSGTITYPVSGDPLAAGEYLMGYLEPERTQERNFTSQKAYYMQTLEQGLDRATQQISVCRALIDKCISVPRAFSHRNAFSSMSDFKSKLLGFDVEGDLDFIDFPTVAVDGDAYNVAHYSALQAITGQADGESARVLGRAVRGDGGGGYFYWDSSNLKTECDADTKHGIYVPAAGDDGTNGAWRRNNDLPFITPEMFGAKGDGSTDDSDAFKAAAYYIYSVLGRGKIQLFSKVYRCNFTIYSDTELCGPSGNSAKLIPATNDAVIKTPSGVSAVRLKLHDFKIDGTATTASYTSADGIRFAPDTAGTWNDTLILDNIEIEGMGRYGLWCYGETTNGPFCQNLVFSNVLVKGCGQNSIRLEGTILESTFRNVMAVRPVSPSAPSFYVVGNTGKLGRLTWIGGGANHASNPTSGTAIHIEDAAQVTLIGVDVEEADTMIYLGGTYIQSTVLLNVRVGSTNAVTYCVNIAKADSLIIDGCSFNSTAGISYGLYSANGLSSIKGLTHRNNRFINCTTPVSVADYGTISGGCFWAYRDYVRIIGEGSAADDLDYIYDSDAGSSTAKLEHGQEINIRSFDTANAITVTNSGNISTLTGHKVVLDAVGSSVTLKWNSNLSKWIQVAGATSEDIMATSAELLDISDDINTDGKYKGKMVFDSTLLRPVWSIGLTAVAAWVYADGTVAHIPS